MIEPVAFPPLRFPDGMDAASFLASHWQRRPLLIRQALAGFANPLPADELAGLACEADAEARILIQQRAHGAWQLLHGPFDAARFASLPETHWTLLVQDVEKHIPEIGGLLDRFSFLPRWRLDDIMVSYAADQGSVGPHVDDYDVFLIQAEGRRRWRIATRPDAPLDLVPDLDVRILAQFEADHEWVLEPGDLLYLPPGVPHWGVAEGPCQTWSVGLRAPGWRELADHWLAEVAERFTPVGRWRDPGLQIPADSAELTPDTVARMRTQLEAGIAAAGADHFLSWLGAWLTEPKLNLELSAQGRTLSQADMQALLEAYPLLYRDGRSLMLFADSCGGGGSAWLFANGQAHGLPGDLAPFASLLANRRTLELEQVRPWLKCAEARALLSALIAAGHYLIPDGPSSG